MNAFIKRNAFAVITACECVSDFAIIVICLYLADYLRFIVRGRIWLFAFNLFLS
ncbi:MAG: hypothetical protein SVR04_17460 [Spirochaetota bacterium]|nr:hypothetical protein [Spirochaetota bacterium]